MHNYNYKFLIVTLLSLTSLTTYSSHHCNPRTSQYSQDRVELSHKRLDGKKEIDAGPLGKFEVTTANPLSRFFKKATTYYHPYPNGHPHTVVLVLKAQETQAAKDAYTKMADNDFEQFLQQNPHATEQECLQRLVSYEKLTPLQKLTFIHHRPSNNPYMKVIPDITPGESFDVAAPPGTDFTGRARLNTCHSQNTLTCEFELRRK